MKFLILSKRRPQGRDLLLQPFGRFYYLPRILAEHGHEVHLLLLSYKNEPPGYRREDRLHIYSSSVLPLGPSAYVSTAKEIVRENGVDWIIGFSDTWYGILAVYLARTLGARTLIDAYDNYESYIPLAKPLHSAWRLALAKADAVTCAGPQLGSLLHRWRGNKPVDIVPMAADPIFRKLDRLFCRRKLGLPLDAKLVGYAGSLHANRGIDFLFEVCAKLQEIDPSIKIVLSGRLFGGVAVPRNAIWLGYVANELVPLVVNSLNLIFVINKPGDFGSYSYPVKLYEAIACGIPVVASNLPPTQWILRDSPHMLADAENLADFVDKARQVLCAGDYNYKESRGWDDSARILENCFYRS